MPITSDSPKVFVRLEPEQWAAMKRLAVEGSRTMPQQLRHAVRVYLQQEGKQ